MNNPFQPPAYGGGAAASPSSPQGPIGTGTLDVARALRDAWEVMMRNAGLVWVAMIVQALVLFVSIIACFLPVLVVGPVITWGYTRLMLDAYDGPTELNVMFSGFQKLGDVWMRTMGVVVATGALAMVFVGAALGIVGVGYLVGEEMGAVGALVLALPLFLVAIVVLLRFSFATPMIADAEVGGFDAVARSWELTSAVWTSLILLVIAQFGVLMVVQIGQMILTMPLALLAGDSTIGSALSGLFSLLVSMVITPFTTAFAQLTTISAYRQVVGTLRNG